MAQIDTASIEGFDAMTADEKVSALLAFQYDDGAEKLKAAEDNAARMKAAFDKASSEAAGYKKQLNASKTEEERAKIEAEETMKAMQERLAEFEKREKISTAKSVFLGGGFDEATAADAADAFTTGDIDKMSAALKKYRVSIEAQIKSSLMDSNPKPDGGEEPDGADKDDNVSIATQLGKARAETAKKAQSILEQYTRR